MEIQDVTNVEIRFRLQRSESERAGRPNRPQAAVETGKLPRITQMLALAIHFEEMVRTGEARNYADLACLGCITRERVSQIIKLRWLAPDIQQEVLQLPRSRSGRFSVCEAKLRSVADLVCWPDQRSRWLLLKTQPRR